MARAVKLSPSLITLLVPIALADHVPEVIVIGKQQQLEVEVSSLDTPEPDTSALLRKFAGANVNSNGPVSGIHQYRGMFGSRVDVNVDGMHITSGGPNLMDPPLHYAPAAMLDTLTIYRGAAPVSIAQESIGGALVANTADGDFGATDDWGVNGHILLGGQTVNQGWTGQGLIAAANDTHKFYASGLLEKANDARFNDGRIRPSEYERKRADLGYSFSSDGHTLELAYGRTETGDAGTPALAMDIKSINANLYRGKYRFANQHWALEASLHGNQVDHAMTNFHLRQAPGSDARWRQNDADSRAAGYRLVAEFFTANAVWRVGTDGQFDSHNSDIINPNNSGFFVSNFNHAQRHVLGVFGESELRFGSDWQLHAGLRYNQVSSDTDEVGASMAMMMPPVANLAARFNEADRHQRDNNVDWVIRSNWSPLDNWRFTAALSRKTRSAAYQERFLWLPLQATGGLADGRNYVGSLDLNPEIGHEIELGFDWETDHVELNPRIFYRKVKDYIQGTPSDDPTVNMVSVMMGNPNQPLQFNNVDARIYGLDLEWGVALNQRFSLYGLLNYIRGQRQDINDDLYRIAPPNTTLGLRFTGKRWRTSLEGLAYGRQKRVSATNGETETAGYAVVNFSGRVNLTDKLVLSAGINNLLNRNYQDHLAGINRAANDDIARGEKLPGWGRNLFARIRWDF